MPLNTLLPPTLHKKFNNYSFTYSIHPLLLNLAPFLSLQRPSPFVAIILVFFGQAIITAIFHLLNITLSPHLMIIITVLRTSISFFAYLTFFLLLFYLSPTIKIKIHEIIPGALVTSIGWSVASIAFSFYANKIANYNKFYGSLSVIIILLFWLYILGYAITVGLQVNYVLKRDYFGGVEYTPRLSFIQRFKFLSKWVNFSDNGEQNLKEKH